MVGVRCRSDFDHASAQVRQDIEHEHGRMFFSNQYADRGDLFEGLSVWEEKTPEGQYRFRELQGTFPVIFVRFASIEKPTYEGMLYQISEEISILYARNRYLLEENVLSGNIMRVSDLGLMRRQRRGRSK